MSDYAVLIASEPPSWHVGPPTAPGWVAADEPPGPDWVWDAAQGRHVPPTPEQLRARAEAQALSALLAERDHRVDALLRTAHSRDRERLLQRALYLVSLPAAGRTPEQQAEYAQLQAAGGQIEALDGAAERIAAQIRAAADPAAVAISDSSEWPAARLPVIGE